MTFAPTRRAFMAGLGGAAAWPLGAWAQQAGKVWRIGVLETTAPALNAVNFEAFREGLRELGYVEGQNVVFAYRSAEGRSERFPELAADLVRLPIDLIVTRGTPAALAAKHATTTIPVVMAGIADPLLAVASLNRPGGNLTGLTTLSSDLHAKRLELLREVIPNIRRVGLLTNFANPATPPQWKDIEEAAQTLHLHAELLDVRKSDDIASAFEAPGTRQVEALVVSTDGFMQLNRHLIAELAVKHRLPTIGGFAEFTAAGGLMVYGPSYPDLYRRAAGYAVKILEGAAPANLPVEQPTRFELVLNLKTAKALGLDIPPTLLARADEVLE